MKTLLNLLLTILLLSSVAYAYEEVGFPKTPNLDETPGKLCNHPSTRRYPEQISYCERSVDSYLKNAVIQKYDNLFGYHIGAMKRVEFKIDHLIPLCAGGANSEENLWPQHQSVYIITDPIEPLLCQKMKEGKLLQAEAIRLIIEAKTQLEKVPVLMKKLRSL